MLVQQYERRVPCVEVGCYNRRRGVRCYPQKKIFYLYDTSLRGGEGVLDFCNSYILQRNAFFASLARLLYIERGAN